jgi:hypothetical protein
VEGQRYPGTSPCNADPRKAFRGHTEDPDIASRIYIVSYNAFGNKYRKILTGQPVQFETISAKPACDPDDEESSLRVKSSYADGIQSELENALETDPQLAERRPLTAFAGFGLIVDEAHRLGRGFASQSTA